MHVKRRLGSFSYCITRDIRHNYIREMDGPTTTATKSLNSVIGRLSSQGLHREVLLTVASTLKSSTSTLDAFTFPSLLKASTSLSLHPLGLSLHQQVIVTGFSSSDPCISCSLINLHAKFNNISYAQKVFDLMPQSDIVPWTAIIGCYSRAHDMPSAFFLYNSMQLEGIQPSSVTILSMLSGVVESVHVDILHACVIKNGHSDIVLMNCLLSVYAKCGRVEAAKELFESSKGKDTVSWNSLINAYSMLGHLHEVSVLLLRMRKENIEPDHHTFGSLFSAVAKDGRVEVGQVVHAQLITSGFELNKHVETSLMVMYAKCKKLDLALQIFDRTGVKDVILWTSMISGLVHNDSSDKALSVFRQMLHSRVTPSTATLACVLASCAEMGYIKLGTSIHCYMLRHRMSLDIPIQNSLVSMYAKCDGLKQSFTVFSMMGEKDVVSWNAIVAGYALNGHLTEALYLFNEMRINCQEPDFITVVSLLQACASIGAYHQGKWIHNFILRSHLGQCIRIGTALVDMYAKCGDLKSAKKFFDKMPHHDMVSWSTIISGYGSHGKGEIALEMYSQFLQNGLVPNDVIFLAVLYACSHNGLVDRGLNLFESMKNVYNIEPKIEHCACVVDLLCRACRVKEAYEFYKKTFVGPVIDVLGIILDACRNHGELELGEIVANEVCVLEPIDAGKFVQLAHSFASAERWEGVGEAWVQMRSLGLRKLPGWSFIEMQGVITPFFTRHNSQPRFAEIVAMLRNLTDDTKELVLTMEHEEILF